MFYGNFNSKQNTKAFFRLYNNIYPLVKNKIPEVQLLVLGANPPKDIIKLNNNNNIKVTGFVSDIREFISSANIFILPLELGAGFRTRVIEVMAMGIPVIGTHNAIDSIELVYGIHGFITENDVEIANYAIELLTDSELRNKISEECIKFVKKKYTIGATYKKLSIYYSDLIL